MTECLTSKDTHACACECERYIVIIDRTYPYILFPMCAYLHAIGYANFIGEEWRIMLYCVDGLRIQ